MGGGEAQAPQWKIPPVQCKSDSLVLYVGRKFGVVGTDDEGNPVRDIVEEGTPYHPHTGESVWIFPVNDLKTYFAVGKLQNWTTGTPEEQQACFKDASAELAKWLVRWNWTDHAGRPLEQPFENPDVLTQLDAAEFAWLIACVRDGPPETEKNGAGGSEPSSLATVQPPKKSR